MSCTRPPISKSASKIPISVSVTPEKFESCVVASATKLLTKSVGRVIMAFDVWEARSIGRVFLVRGYHPRETSRMINPFNWRPIAKARNTPMTAASNGRKACTVVASSVENCATRSPETVIMGL